MNDMKAGIMIDGIGVLLMTIILLSLIKNFKSGVVADKIFFLLVLSVLVVCAMEILGTVFNETTFFGARFLNRLFNVLLFAITPLPSYLWALYATCKVYDTEIPMKKRAFLLAIPFIVVIAMSFANLFADIFFSITADNVYQRTDFFFVATLLSLVYMVYVSVLLVLQRKVIGKQLYFPLLSFMILPLIGLTLQSLFYVYLIWISVAISIVIIFNYVQNDNSITDWLTGLYNRRHLDNYLAQMCKRKRETQLVGYMADVDDFKRINDTYGHLMGDQALKDIASLLKTAIGKKAYIARYAGDEFVMILDLPLDADLNGISEKLHQALQSYNRAAQNPFPLDMSVGCAVYQGNGETVDEFLSRIDREMYAEKKAKISRNKSASGTDGSRAANASAACEKFRPVFRD